MKKMMLGLVMVVMMFAMVGCGETKKEGFVPEQVTETPNDTKEVLNDEIKEEIDDVANGDLTKYYDVEKYVGTPRLVTCRYMGGGLNPVAEEEGLTVYQIEDDDRLENLKKYDCIICDNDTPDYQDDDVVVYIFTE